MASKGDGIRFAQLGKGWTRELADLYLTRRGAWYSRAEAEEAETLETWRRDAARTAEGRALLYSRNDLKERGWTPTLIKHFLGDPDLITTLNNSGTRVFHRWHWTRILTVEAVDKWREAAEKAVTRSKAGKAAAEKRAAKTLAWAKALEIKLADGRALSRLRKEAARAYDELWLERGRWGKTATGGDRAFSDRITVNYLRHDLSHYENLLADSFGLVGAGAARALIRKRVLEEIATRYPELATECRVQLCRR